MALGLNKIIISGISSNAPGAYWSLTSVSANNTTVVIPAGTYLVFPTANVTIEAVSAYNATSGVATFSTLLANNTGGVIISDGTNVRANVTVATNTTVTLATVSGGQNISGTFNT
jgi:hypothetical protein